MIEKFFEFIEEKLEKLKEQNLYRNLRDVKSKEGMKIRFGKNEYINFASNDYLGLSQHPLVKEVAQQAIKFFGVGAGASRILCGGTVLHERLEKLIAKLKETESALVFNSGYAANISIIPAITDENDIIFSDELNHASIIDGCRLSKAKRLIYRHGDLENLEDLIKRNNCRGNRFIITDSVFSMDGDIAPIRDLYDLCLREGIILYIDDAHGTGVLGEGLGVLRHFGIKSDRTIIQMGTLSKALGTFGAFVAGSYELIDYLINNSRGFIFSTALPPCVIASAYASIKLIIDDRELVKKLWDNTEKVMNKIRDMELRITNTQTPIIPILFDNIEDTIKASKVIEDFGIYAPAIRPPTSKNPRIRITISAAHSDEDIERLIKALQKIN